MRNSFLELCVRWTGDIECDVADDAMMAYENCDIALFKKEREVALRSLGASRHRSTQQVFEYDLDTSSRLVLLWSYLIT